MEDVMYGVMFNAKLTFFQNEPPVNASKEIECITGIALEPLFEIAAIDSRDREAGSRYG